MPGGRGQGSGQGSAAAVGGLDLVDVNVTGPVDRVEGGAGDRVAGGRRRPVLDANGPAGLFGVRLPRNAGPGPLGRGLMFRAGRAAPILLAVDEGAI